MAKKKANIANVVSTEKKARSFLKPNEDFFVWSIRSDKIDWEHGYFGFNSEILSNFSTDIKPILDSYTTMTWHQVDKRKSCHSIDAEKLGKPLKDRLFELHNELAPETLYQINLDATHRIWGYKEKSIFYILFNDPEHKGYPVEKKHT